ncbi:NAD-dependent epimerase/dehydratase family protein [Alicyclobacillus suci]|uniref:NAD-dependent epimerase/dehydratase family protein n=1 Tax=Alicyclobacillus suci TaxID=2816080 RepID=UPI001A8D13A1|nr:NAD-dependent epimerase/dehydratase family protein [Alicyclobacillus suci]
MERIHPQAKFYFMDIRPASLPQVFALEKPDVVNHHAAQKSVPKSVEDPRLDADLNVTELLNLLKCCRHYDVKKFIFISSGGALAGDAPVMPTDESVNPVMISPYAIHKYVGEKYLHFYRGTTRDYVYVKDVAEANVLALTAADDEILNISSGEEIHTADIYHLIVHTRQTSAEAGTMAFQ